MHDIARIVCHDLTYKYGKITPGYVPNSLVILYDISCVILQNPAFFFYKILQEFLLGNLTCQTNKVQWCDRHLQWSHAGHQ